MITLSESPETVRALAQPILRFKTNAEIKAEKILDGWEDDRNRDLLLEMNGSYCSHAQQIILRDNNFFATADETSEEFDARMILLSRDSHRPTLRDRRDRRKVTWNDDCRYNWTAIGRVKARSNAGKGGNT